MDEYDDGSCSYSSEGDGPQSTGATGATGPSSSQHGSKRRARFTEEERKDRRRTANRESARRMRAKRNEAMGLLHDSVGLLTKQNQQLQHENKAILKRLQRMEAENQSLRDRMRRSTSQDTGERQLAGVRSLSKHASEAVTGAPQVSTPVDSEDGPHSTQATKRRKTHAAAAAAAGQGSSHGNSHTAYRSSSQGLKPVGAGHHSLRPSASSLARVTTAEGVEHPRSCGGGLAAAAGDVAAQQGDAAQGWLPGVALPHPGTPQVQVGPIRFPSDLQQQQQLHLREAAAAAAAPLPPGAQHLHMCRQQQYPQLGTGDTGLAHQQQPHRAAAAGGWGQQPEAAGSVASAPCFSRCSSGGEPLGLTGAQRSSSWGNPAYLAPATATAAAAAGAGPAAEDAEPQLVKKRRSWSPSDLLLGDADILEAGDADVLGICLDSPLLTATELAQQQHHLSAGSQGLPSPVLAAGSSPVLPGLAACDNQPQLCEWEAPGDLLDILLQPPPSAALQAAEGAPAVATAAVRAPLSAVAPSGGVPPSVQHTGQQPQPQQQQVEMISGVGDLARRLSDLGTAGGDPPSSSGPLAAPGPAAAAAGAAGIASTQTDGALAGADGAAGKQPPAITAADVFGKRPQALLPGLGSLPWSLGGATGGVPAPLGAARPMQAGRGALPSPMAGPAAGGSDKEGSPGDGGLKAACNAYAALHAAWSQGLPGAPGASAAPAAAAPTLLASGQRLQAGSSAQEAGLAASAPAAAAAAGAVLPGLLAPLAGTPVPAQLDPLEQWAHKHAIPGVGDLLDQVSSLLNMGAVPPPPPSGFGSGGSDGGQHRRRYPLKRPSKLALLGGAAGGGVYGQRQVPGSGSGGTAGLHKHSSSGGRHHHHRHHRQHNSNSWGATPAGLAAGMMEDWGGSAVGSLGRASRRSEGGGGHSYLQQSSGQLSRHTGPHRPVRDGSGSPTAEHLGASQQQQQRQEASPQAQIPTATGDGPIHTGAPAAALLLPSAFAPVAGVHCSSRGRLGGGPAETFGWAAPISSPPAAQQGPLVRGGFPQPHGRYQLVAASELHGGHSMAVSGAADGCRSFASDPGPFPAPSASQGLPPAMDWAPGQVPAVAAAGGGAVLESAVQSKGPPGQEEEQQQCRQPQQEDEQQQQQQHVLGPTPAHLPTLADDAPAADAGPWPPCSPPPAPPSAGAAVPAASAAKGGNGGPCEEEDQGDWVDALSTLMQREQAGALQSQWAGQGGPVAAVAQHPDPAAPTCTPAAQPQCSQVPQPWQQDAAQQQQQVVGEAVGGAASSHQGERGEPGPGVILTSSAMELSWQQQQLWLQQQAWQQQQQLQQLLGLQQAASAAAAAGVSSGGASSTCSLVTMPPEASAAGYGLTPSAAAGVAGPGALGWSVDAVGALEQMAAYGLGINRAAGPLLYATAAATAAAAGGGQLEPLGLLSQAPGQPYQMPVMLQSAQQQWEGAAAWQQVPPPAAAGAAAGAAAAAGDAGGVSWGMLPLGSYEPASNMAPVPPGGGIYDTIQHLLGQHGRPSSTNGSSGASGLGSGVSLGRGGSFRPFRPAAQASSQEGSAAAAEASGQGRPSRTPPSS